MPPKTQWRDLANAQPAMSLITRVQYKGRVYKPDIEDETCREALIYNIGDWMGELAEFRSEDNGGYDPMPWKKKETVTKSPPPKDRIILDVEALRQAESTRLVLYFDPYENEYPACTHPCCTAGLVDAVNTLVSLPALLLNPDRYTGNWWEQTEEQMLDLRNNYDGAVLHYWGADNSILHHPALVSIIFGLLRQAHSLHSAGFLEGLSKAVPPKAVRQALFNSDEKAALKLIQQAKPWIFCPTANTHFPISGPGKWELFLNLHKALYQHGFAAVFGEIENAWELASRGIKTLSGSHSYFQNKKRVENVNKLAKKAA